MAAIDEVALARAVAGAAEAAGPKLGTTAIAFLKSNYGHGLERYRRRLTAVGLNGGERLLDAGCGFGQWSLAAAGSFGSVAGIDISADRVEVCRRLAAETGTDNCAFHEGRLESLPFADGEFDAVVTYSALYFTDYPRAIAELGRVLKRGGRLYLNTNDVGRYVADIIRNSYRNADFNSRRYGLAAIGQTIVERLTGRRIPGRAIAMPLRRTQAALLAAGFEIVEAGSEGSLGQGDAPWQVGRYACLPGSYDILARRG